MKHMHTAMASDLFAFVRYFGGFYSRTQNRKAVRA